MDIRVHTTVLPHVDPEASVAFYRDALGFEVRSDLVWLRWVRDRIDREYARPLDVEVLARGVDMSAEQLGRQFREAYGESPYAYLVTRRTERAMALLCQGGVRAGWGAGRAGWGDGPVRNQEAQVMGPRLA